MDRWCLGTDLYSISASLLDDYRLIQMNLFFLRADYSVAFHLHIRKCILDLTEFFFYRRKLFHQRNQFILTADLSSCQLTQHFIIILLAERNPQYNLACVHLYLIQQDLVYVWTFCLPVFSGDASQIRHLSHNFLHILNQIFLDSMIA